MHKHPAQKYRIRYKKLKKLMTQRFSPTFLIALRNRIPINTLILSILKIPAKYSENYLRFLCPLCSDFHTATNSDTNLARCFRCQKNFNPIDMVMAVNNCGFIKAVRFLKPLLPSRLHPLNESQPDPMRGMRDNIKYQEGGVERGNPSLT